MFAGFWTRNIIFLVFILILARLNNDRGSFENFSFERFKIYFSYLVDYGWVLFHNKILVERFLLRKKWRVYAALLPLSYLSYLPFFYFFDPQYEPGWASVFTAVMNLSAIKLLGLGLYFIVHYLLERERFYKATITAKELEMHLLKGQLNPHFLFNALNNIYSHLLTGSKNGQELILKLSELMRYILDSNKKEYVTLGEELKFIDNYIAFERERLGDRCEVIFQKEIEDASLHIAPLILFTFIENAFKHGTIAIRQSVIKISIIGTSEQLNLVISNPIYQTEKQSTKVGLSNTKRRLELLYPDKHKIGIDTRGERYLVHFNVILPS